MPEAPENISREDQFDTAYNNLRELFLKAYPGFTGFGEDERYRSISMEKGIYS